MSEGGGGREGEGGEKVEWKGTDSLASSYQM